MVMTAGGVVQEHFLSGVLRHVVHVRHFGELCEQGLGLGYRLQQQNGL